MLNTYLKRLPMQWSISFQALNHKEAQHYLGMAKRLGKLYLNARSSPLVSRIYLIIPIDPSNGTIASEYKATEIFLERQRGRNSIGHSKSVPLNKNQPQIIHNYHKLCLGEPRIHVS